MDLRPFERIHPCGHAGLKTIDLSTIGVRASWDEVGDDARRQARRLPEPAMTILGPYDPTQKQKAEAKTSRIPIRIVPAGEVLKKPDWIRVKAGSPSSRFYEIKQILREHRLHTVCEEASCPNIGECFGNGTATFMIMGDKCTRRCPFCDVGHGRPDPLDARRADQPGQDDRGAEAEVRRHHERRPRRPARRRRRPLRRLHREDARALARRPGSRSSRPISAAAWTARSRSCNARRPT